MIQRLGYFIIAISILIIAGCKHGPPVTVKKAPFQLPNGWKKWDAPEQGISIAAPAQWAIGTSQTVFITSMTEDPSASNQAKIDKANEDRGRADVQALAEKHIYISCVNRNVTRIVGETATHFNIKKETGGGNAQMEDVLKLINDDLTNEDAPTYVELPIGKAVKVHAHNVLKDGGEVDYIDYGVVNNSDMYIVRFSTEQQGFDLDKEASAIVQTLRIDK